MILSSAFICLVVLFFFFYRKIVKQSFKEKELFQDNIRFKEEKEKFAELLRKREEELGEMQKALLASKIENKELETFVAQQKKGNEEKLLLLTQTQEKLAEAFKALSADALEKSNHSFLTLANQTLEKFQEKAKGELDKKQQTIEEMVTPVKESLKKLDVGMQEIEKARKGEQERLKEQMHQMLETEKELKKETQILVKALRMPLIRGQWGEMHLRRVVELAGMVSHCDFYQQETADSGQMRPDLIVRLPGNKQVIVDAKTPCEAYLEGMQSQDLPFREEKLKAHARQLRQHVVALGRKEYWQSFAPTPEFVVLFIPSDSFFSAALEADPSLIELGVEQGVVLATPTTFIGLLRAIAYGWKQEQLSLHAQEVSTLGHELYKRLCDMGSHWGKVGRNLSTAVDSYNKAVGTLESRVFVSARKLKELGAASDHHELEILEPIDQIPRKIQSLS